MSAGLVVLPVPRERDEEAVLQLTGELDLTSETTLISTAGELLAGGKRWIVLDCAGLTFCDSRGINAFLMLRQRLSAQDGGLALARVTEQVRHVFGLSGLDEVLTMAADVEAAFGLLMRTQPDEKPR